MSKASSWHTLPLSEIAAQLDSNIEEGLSTEEAERRLKAAGLNRIEDQQVKSMLRILWEQFTGVMMVMLLIAAGLSFILGDAKDGIVILVIVVLNAVLGFSQEYRAEQAVAALKAMAKPKARVKRNGKTIEISSEEIVPGDVVVLEAGDIVPADGRLIKSICLQVQESALTGESQPVNKDPYFEAMENTAVADRHNMVYSSTSVSNGRGTALVTVTGMDSEVGKIATMLQSVEERDTPLQYRLKEFAKVLALAALALVLLIFMIGLLQGKDLKEMFFIAISMAVAAVPEGLPAVVTVTLAIGARRMLRRKALVRNLEAVETLGSVDVICTDKTGTITENKMNVEIVAALGANHDFQEYEIENDLHEPVRAVLVGCILCNDSELSDGDQNDIGDPTELAMLRAAKEKDISRAEWEKKLPRVDEVPFSSETKRMITVHSLGEDAVKSLTDLGLVPVDHAESASHLLFMKGAVTEILDEAKYVWSSEEGKRLDEVLKRAAEESEKSLASKGMRVLGIGYKLLDKKPSQSDLENEDQGIVFLGLIGLIDPPRSEAQEAVKTCKRAGILPVMITGDHALTAAEIAKQVEIDSGDKVISGLELYKMDKAELMEAIKSSSIFARVSPADKIKIVEAYQGDESIVAMTGDGVNDAPALKKADVGIAMGLAGTDVSRKSADIVLLDDNFSTIVAAIKEGRIIYDNIRKFIKYMLAGNIGELWVMLLGPLMGLPLPLTALQILWINLVTDGLPALALAVEDVESQTMKRPPYDIKENLISKEITTHILWAGFLVGTLPLLLGMYYYHQGFEYWQTVVFAAITIAQMSHVMAVRRHGRINVRNFFSNIYLLFGVLSTLLLLLALVYIPMLQRVFDLNALPGRDLAIIVGVCTIVFFVVELEKVIRQRTSKT